MVEIGKKCSVKDCHQPIKTRGFCNKHYVRWQRHGHAYDTRPSDWGCRERHPLYVLWCGLRRAHSGQMCERWQDFWKFADDIKERPVISIGKPQLKRRDESQGWFLENVYWKERGFSSEKAKEYQKVYRENNKRKCHNRELQRLYKISVDDYEKMLAEQNGVCKICGLSETSVDPKTKRIRRLHVDHCHNSIKVRALLCSFCNRGLGNFKDDINLLAEAIEYIKFYT